MRARSLVRIPSAAVAACTVRNPAASRMSHASFRFMALSSTTSTVVMGVSSGRADPELARRGPLPRTRGGTRAARLAARLGGRGGVRRSRPAACCRGRGAAERRHHGHPYASHRYRRGDPAAELLRTSAPDVGVVVLSQYATPSYALALLESGSAGRSYLLKDRVGDVEQLVSAIRAVAEGGSVTTRRWSRPLSRRTPGARSRRLAS